MITRDVVGIKNNFTKNYFNSLGKYNYNIIYKPSFIVRNFGQTEGEILKYSKAIYSYFCLPEQGMEKYDVLSRASIIIIPTTFKKNEVPNFPCKYHILAPAHVTHPWLFPQYYVKEHYPWLSFVTEKAVINKLNIRKQKNGQMIFETNFKKKYYLHPKKDLILLHINDEENVINQVSALGIPWSSLFLNINIAEGDPVTLIGHELQTKTDDIDSTTERLIPTWTYGKVSLMNNKQGYISTPTPIQMGMCGGPVINKDGNCVGIIEAVVSQLKERARGTPGAVEFYNTIAIILYLYLLKN